MVTELPNYDRWLKNKEKQNRGQARAFLIPHLGGGDNWSENIRKAWYWSQG